MVRVVQLMQAVQAVQAVQAQQVVQVAQVVLEAVATAGRCVPTNSAGRSAVSAVDWN
jgi:hypothetical protein